MPRFQNHLFVLAAMVIASVLFAGCSSSSKTQSGCKSNAECKSGQLCVPTKDAAGKPGPNACVAGAECASDAECTARDARKLCSLDTHKCAFRPGFANECSDTRPCAFGQFCSTLLGKCLDASASRDCTRRSQCPSRQICDLHANKCITDTGCYGDNFCEHGEACDLVAHVCRSSATECATCIVDGQCPAATTCSAASRECLAAGDAAKCRRGESCDPLGRCVQCTTREQCGAGLFCNTALGRCESNVQCAQDPSLCPDSPDVRCVMCIAPEICDIRTKRCAAPAATCTSEVDCPGDQYCNRMLDPPVCAARLPDCLPDRFDPNNGPGVAAILDPAQGPQYDELKICPGESDWFKIAVARGTYLTVEARFMRADGDINMELYLADGRTLIGASRSQTNLQRLSLEVGTDLTLLVRVYVATPTINAVSYKIVVTREPGEICAQDPSGPHDSPDRARILEADVPFDGRICAATPDWFVLRGVPGGTRIHITLRFVNTLGDLDLELYRAGSVTPLVSSLSRTGDEELTYDASYSGDYYLRVFGHEADSNVYTIRADLRPNAGAMCRDDQFEPNDLPTMTTQAAPIVGMPTNLTICTGDEDWFQVQLAGGEAMTAEIGFNPGVDLDLGLFPAGTTDPRIVPLRRSIGVTMREYLAYRATAPGDYLLRVYGHDRQQVSPYELRLDKKPPFICMPDRIRQMGRGLSMATAFDLPFPPARLDDLTVCMNDAGEWFRVLVRGGFQNVIRAQFIESDATLNFDVLDGTGRLLGTTAGVVGSDSREIAINVPGLGISIVYIRVFKASGRETAYNLTVDLIPVFVCGPDLADPNNTTATASRVASSTVTPIEIRNLMLCPNVGRAPFTQGEEDWFLIRPPRAGARIKASIEYLQGDLFLELRSPGGGKRACQNRGDDRCYSDGAGRLTEMVAFTATTSAPYYLRVSSVYSGPLVRMIPPEADTSYTLRVEYTGP